MANVLKKLEQIILESIIEAIENDRSYSDIQLNHEVIGEVEFKNNSEVKTYLGNYEIPTTQELKVNYSNVKVKVFAKNGDVMQNISNSLIQSLN